jgi:hypothetical protein
MHYFCQNVLVFGKSIHFEYIGIGYLLNGKVPEFRPNIVTQRVGKFVERLAKFAVGDYFYQRFQFRQCHFSLNGKIQFVVDSSTPLPQYQRNLHKPSNQIADACQAIDCLLQVH